MKTTFRKLTALLMALLLLLMCFGCSSDSDKGDEKESVEGSVGKDEKDKTSSTKSSLTDSYTISAGDFHTVGLKSSGTVLATEYTGDYYNGQCDVSGWTDIKLP